MKVKSGKMFAIPYCNEINDIPLYIRKGYTGAQYLQSVIDQFDALYADSHTQPRVMGVPLHPMIPASRCASNISRRPSPTCSGTTASGSLRQRDHRRVSERGVNAACRMGGARVLRAIPIISPVARS